MACEGLNCNVSNATFEYTPIGGNAPMYDEGDVVTYDVDQIELNEHASHTGELVIRSAKNVKWVTVTVMLFPCSDWYKALYNAWIADVMLCGELMINDPCCMPIVVSEATVMTMGIKPVSHDTTPTEVSFRGILGGVVSSSGSSSVSGTNTTTTATTGGNGLTGGITGGISADLQNGIQTNLGGNLGFNFNI